jgi:hypothetical protein
VNPVRYLWLLAFGAICGVFYAATIGPDAMMRCDPHGVDATHYMAYCNVKTFTEYDLGAHYLGLEPEAIQSMQAADVLFLGNSRTGHTFSSAATQAFMDRLGAKYYIMGFGYEASSMSALSLIDKYRLHPKVMIINADPFFGYGDRAARDRLLSGRPQVYLEYLIKKRFQLVQSFLCGRSEMFCGHALTIYRSAVNGTWDVHEYAAAHPGSKNPKIIIEEENYRSSELPDALKAGREFVDRVSVAPDCMIVTSIPSPRSTQMVAKAVAAEIGSTYIVPAMTDLRTFDNSHLIAEDDERWSAEMLRQAAAQIQKCLQ